MIFVDDLDRCSDTTVFALLEAIKLYLSSRHCLFVFGLDRAHVETAVARAGSYTHQEAAQYLEKLFQARLYLPLPAPAKLRGFVEEHLNALGLKDGEAALLVKVLPPNPRLFKTVHR